MTKATSLEELAPAGATPASYRFQLFVTGNSLLSRRAREHVERHLVGPLGNRAEVEIVDLIADPIAARRERIVATPTLIRLEPSPVVRLIGDLTDFDRVRTLVLVGDDCRLVDGASAHPAASAPLASAPPTSAASRSADGAPSGVAPTTDPSPA
ncbi:circadian clock KaiB family protein [Alienimonas californiensis]|uniref:Circadian clock protein KaiB n=1 Tax=Alienimonas californiensis TaxID=2527989 RepID=A0A517P709_9PLAN|nr:circadian clock KaiB family protein [Alienimonas californiensis]QDT15143.1 Circadian clock protein KaiB [Alienimonas californiensis]